MKVRAVIFDLDGTLTEPTLDFDRIRQEMGIDSRQGVLEAMEQMSRQARQRAEAILARYEQAAAQSCRLNSGAGQLLDHLRQRGIRIGLLTRNTRTNVMLVAGRHKLHFDGIVDRSDVPVKPDGHGVRLLCRQFGIAPGQALVVGDYRHDLEAARAAGAPSALVRTHPDAGQFCHLADFIIHRLDELPAIIDNLEKETV